LSLPLTATPSSFLLTPHPLALLSLPTRRSSDLYAALAREEARGRMRQLLAPGTILCLPTTPFPAPRCGQPVSATTALRARIICRSEEHTSELPSLTNLLSPPPLPQNTPHRTHHL